MCKKKNWVKLAKSLHESNMCSAISSDECAQFHISRSVNWLRTNQFANYGDRAWKCRNRRQYFVCRHKQHSFRIRGVATQQRISFLMLMGSRGEDTDLLEKCLRVVCDFGIIYMLREGLFINYGDTKLSIQTPPL